MLKMKLQLYDLIFDFRIKHTVKKRTDKCTQENFRQDKCHTESVLHRQKARVNHNTAQSPYNDVKPVHGTKSTHRQKPTHGQKSA